MVDDYKVSLCGITNAGHDHSSCLTTVKQDLYSENNTNVDLYTGSISPDDCLDYIKKSSVFTSRSHGDVKLSSSGEAITTGIILNDSTPLIGLYSHSNALLDSQCRVINSTDSFDDSKLILFVGCETAYGGAGANNLPTIVVEQGAEVAVGFESNITCSEANEWTKDFYAHMLAGYTVKESAEWASENRGALSGLSDYVICGNNDYKFGE